MKRFLLTVVSAAVFITLTSSSFREEVPDKVRVRKLEQASDLYERGMYERAGAIFASLADDPQADEMWTEGCRVISAARLSRKGYEAMMENYIRKYPYSGLIPQILYIHSENLFDAGDYAGASAVLEGLSPKKLYRRQIPALLFRRAYCDFRNGETDRAKTRFKELAERPGTDFTAPSEYYLAYMLYQDSEFEQAEKWFDKSSSDHRFKELAEYYIIECRFMRKDHAYVADRGAKLLETVPEDRRPQLSRLVSESFLVLGNVSSAESYYNKGGAAGKPADRTDYFYAGSLRYALKDWQGAIDNFSLMSDRSDSLGQAANCRLAFSYIRTGNKVAAMDAFKAASSVDFDPELTEDAFYNYAKLAFDLNRDISVFESYLSRYSDRKRGDRIYAYMAMGALASRDYAAAVEAYDKIDVLDDDMKSNYMKANYLRAEELVSGGSWRDAVPCLKAAAYYSDRRGGFNQLSRYWLAESYFRSANYAQALSVLMDLYNTSALYGTSEASLIPYNIGYCHFMKGDYETAYKWFSQYTASGSGACRKEALVRMGDCRFLKGDYKGAQPCYGSAVSEYPDRNDIYPYYREALCWGLMSDNSKKVDALLPVLQADSDADFYPEAVYELGLAYSKAGDADKAGGCFRMLTEDVRDSTYMALSLIEMGTMARKASRPDEALGYYKRVVELMPVSEYAETSLMAIESVYQSLNDPEGYLAYIDGIGKTASKSEGEKEQMIFNAAEQVFLSGNWQKAAASLKSYIDKYPAGANVPQALFYLGETFRQTGQTQNACDCYSKAVGTAEGAVREMSLLRYSELSAKLQRYDDAYRGYSELYGSALIPQNKSTSAAGMMRSAFSGRKYADALKAVAIVRGDSGTDSALRTEAAYIEAKSLLALSRRDEAMEAFKPLAESPKTEYGAEASYILIQDCYDRGDFDAAEEKVYAFSDSGTSRQYWLAKAFIVLGDTFVEKGDFEQAKATFESVRDGYNPQKPDDVQDSVGMRLRKLAELMSGAE
ncbi:MAG: tetratricopeptide repeat protein [Candidatus Cryptobacteroides sp.]